LVGRMWTGDRTGNWLWMLKLKSKIIGEEFMKCNYKTPETKHVPYLWGTVFMYYLLYIIVICICFIVYIIILCVQSMDSFRCWYSHLIILVRLHQCFKWNYHGINVC
jgi:hypothetical protein